MLQHLSKEGYRQTSQAFIEESGTKLPVNFNFQDQFKSLNEIISDLKAEKTETALQWVKQNSKAINENGGSAFIFKLHEANVRKMLHEAVEIYFHLNFKHLCDKEMNDESEGQIREQSSLAVEEKQYTTQDYEGRLIQYVNYFHVNLVHLFSQQSLDKAAEDKTNTQQARINQMMGALAYIPEYSKQRYHGVKVDANDSQKPYAELFDEQAMK